MAFNIGDNVLVIDDNLSGIVKKIDGPQVSIETKDGFILDFNEDELLITNQSHDIVNQLFTHSNIDDIISEKENSIKKNKTVKRVKDRYEPTMEVDLHINQLVKSTKGMANHDMLTLQLNTAKRQLDFAIKNRIQKIVFIHGVGEGVLKLELDYLFDRYNNVKHYDANYQKYGLGATEVYIYQNIKPAY
jgi:DNA-nicking Smr family endonuclease